MTAGPTRDHLGRPAVAVTGVGLVTPLGFGVAESWSGLVAGRSAAYASGRNEGHAEPGKSPASRETV